MYPPPPPPPPELSVASRPVFPISYCELDNRIAAQLTSDTAALRFIHQELVPKWSAPGSNYIPLIPKRRFRFPEFRTCRISVRLWFSQLHTTARRVVDFYDFEYAGLDDHSQLIVTSSKSTFQSASFSTKPDEFGRHLDRREALRLAFFSDAHYPTKMVLHSLKRIPRYGRGAADQLQAHLRMPPLGNINLQKQRPAAPS